ncbi:MAG: FkbM family methyltransferase [Coleofasciculus sp. G3-WIS-01]|uniref:FkbM family methyltransferase n=1 Tax=Coleofasciculus sp. G3-WIS-01 TaxID=3069528 RepID=UPI003302F035
MHVEACCQDLLEQVLPLIDPTREGICIDVGVGTFAFYCERFSRLGFKTVAVEPLPVKKLQNLCQRYNIDLIKGCLSDINGDQTLYMGKFIGLFNHNFNSLSADWFGSSKKIKQVKSVTLSNLLSSINAEKVTCLKLDIEGWESKIIKQFHELSPFLLPRVVMFEYGGGTSKKNGKGGWSPTFINATLECLSVLKQCGYGLSVMVDYAYSTKETIFDLQSSTLDINEIIPTHSIYGNIISFHNWNYPEEKITQICSPYYGGVAQRLLTTIFSRTLT